MEILYQILHLFKKNCNIKIRELHNNKLNKYVKKLKNLKLKFNLLYKNRI